MGSLTGRWESRGEPELAAEAARQLEAGQGWAEVASALGLAPGDLVAALAWLALGGDGEVGPDLVQSRPKRPGLAGALGADAVGTLFPEARPVARVLLAAGVLQVHDLWVAGHEAAQEADDLGDRDLSAWWHGIAHRREPDAGNASYWFRRVGRSPIFAELAEDAGPVVEEEGSPAWARKVIRDGGWDPFGFIDACNARDGARLARRLQRLELDRLLAATLSACGG
jgi:hypothetical protein